MIGGLLILAAAAFGGTVLTWLFDDRAPGYARVATGTTIGFTILAFAGFIAAMVVGMGPAALVLAGLAALLPALALGRSGVRGRVLADLAEGRRGAAGTIGRIAARRITAADLTKGLYVAGLGLVLWFVAERTLFMGPDGLYIGNVNNLGDLPYHVAITTSFAYGSNFPPQNPVFSGGGFSYHYISDFLTALPVAAGMDLVGAWLVVTVVLLATIAAVIHRWARDITGNPVAARLTPLIVLGSGGLGWLMLFGQAAKGERGIVDAFLTSDARYTIDADGFFRFGNAVTTLLIPQRGLLLGFGLAVIVFTLLWQQLNLRDREKSPGATRALGDIPGVRRMLAAGLITGVLPIVHIHTFAVIFGTAFLLGVAFQQWRDGRWRAWAVYVVATIAGAVPTLLWTARGSQASFTAFLGVEIGWDSGDYNLIQFWAANAGPFIVLLALAYAWDWERPIVPRRLFAYTIVFMAWFLLANVLRLAPWIWDNIKVLIFWWLGGAPVVALLLARIWERRGAAGRAGAVLVLLVVIGAGVLDIARATIGPRTFREWDADGVAFAQAIRDKTGPRAVILTAPTYNSAVLLSGRPQFMGYAGWLFANGLPYSEREQDVRVMYGGAAGAQDLLRRHGIKYIVLGPQERAEIKPNEEFLAGFPTVIEIGNYRLLQVPAS